MTMTVSIDLDLEDVEALVQSLETCTDDTLKIFVEQVLLKVHEKSETLKDESDAFEKINPFSMCKCIKERF